MSDVELLITEETPVGLSIVEESPVDLSVVEETPIDLTVGSDETEVNLEITEETPIVLELFETGPQGPPGPPGELVTGSGDLTYTQVFSAASSITVNHQLGKRPSVTIIDTSNTELEAFVEHLSLNTVLITLSAPTSGTIICN